MCQRYYEKSYNQTVALGTANAAGYAQWYNAQTSTSATLHIPFKVTKRANPSLMTIYSLTTGASGNLRDITGGTDVASTTSGVGEGGFLMQTNAVGSLASYAGHYTAYAEL